MLWLPPQTSPQHESSTREWKNQIRIGNKAVAQQRVNILKWTFQGMGREKTGRKKESVEEKCWWKKKSLHCIFTQQLDRPLKHTDLHCTPLSVYQYVLLNTQMLPSQLPYVFKNGGGKAFAPLQAVTKETFWSSRRASKNWLIKPWGFLSPFTILGFQKWCRTNY